MVDLDPKWSVIFFFDVMNFQQKILRKKNYSQPYHVTRSCDLTLFKGATSHTYLNRRQLSLTVYRWEFFFCFYIYSVSYLGLLSFPLHHLHLYFGDCVRPPTFITD